MSDSNTRGGGPTGVSVGVGEVLSSAWGSFKNQIGTHLIFSVLWVLGLLLSSCLMSCCIMVPFAGALGASRLLFLTDVPGVLDKDKKLIDELTVSQAKGLIVDGTVSGGMIPKVETCIEAIERGVEGVVILNGKTPHAVLLELFTEHGAGTLIVP